MSEPTAEHQPQDTDETTTVEPPDTGLIPDEALPADLQPKENPLAGDPDDGSGDGSEGDPGEPRTQAMPDMGQPG